MAKVVNLAPQKVVAGPVGLGDEVECLITGFAGVVTGYVEYLTGCNQALVVPRVGKDGSFKSGEWFDVQRLRVKRRKVITIDNGPTPGSDRAPPKR